MPPLPVSVPIAQRFVNLQSPATVESSVESAEDTPATAPTTTAAAPIPAFNYSVAPSRNDARPVATPPARARLRTPISRIAVAGGIYATVAIFFLVRLVLGITFGQPPRSQLARNRRSSNSRALAFFRARRTPALSAAPGRIRTAVRPSNLRRAPARHSASRRLARMGARGTRRRARARNFTRSSPRRARRAPRAAASRDLLVQPAQLVARRAISPISPKKPATMPRSPPAPTAPVTPKQFSVFSPRLKPRPAACGGRASPWPPPDKRKNASIEFSNGKGVSPCG